MLFTRLFEQLRKRGYEIKQLSPTHFRVEAVLDLYPVRCRWHNIATSRRGDWIQHRREPDMVKFIDDQVAQADKILDKAIAEGKFQEEICRMDQPEPQQRTLALGEKKRFLREKDKPFWARG